jgi:predicted TIM-barrel fold metal-dependent hydrolase
MMSALHIIDADGHIREEVGEIQEYLEPPFGGRKFFFPLWPGDGRFRGARIHSTPAQLWQDYMDAVGIEKAVLYPTLGLSHGLIQEADWACALARAYNTWLHERFMKADPRLQGVAILPVQDPQEAVKELRRCVRELGMVAGLLPAVTYHRKPYGGPEFHPIFREAENLGCALAIHGSPQSGLGLEVFDRHIEAHVLSHPLPIAMHCISIVLGGLIEKFPNVRVVFLEAGSSWVPFLMERMDFELERLKPSFEWRPSAAPPISKKPSEYFTAGNIYVGCEAAEKSLPWVAQFLGADHIVFPTDFPHSFAFERFVEEVRGFVDRRDLPPDLSQKILWDNPKRLYRI